VLDTADMPVVAERRAWPWLLAGAGVLLAAGVTLGNSIPITFRKTTISLNSCQHSVWLRNAERRRVSQLEIRINISALPRGDRHLRTDLPWHVPLVWIAVHVLDDRNATIEVFCWIHLLLGYCATYWLGRRLNLAAPLASAFSLCQVLSGFALIGGRSWYYMTPIYLWVPLLFVALLQVCAHAPTLRWTIGTGVRRRLLLSRRQCADVGLCVELGGSFVLWSCLNRSMPWLRIVQILPAGLIGIGIAAVLLVPQFLATRELQRTGGTGWDIREGVFASCAVSDADRDGSSRATNIHRAGAFRRHVLCRLDFHFRFVGAFLIVGLWTGTARWFLRDPWKGLAALTFFLALGHLARLWTGNVFARIRSIQSSVQILAVLSFVLVRRRGGARESRDSSLVLARRDVYRRGGLVAV